jgi:hypothetical protein
MSSTELEGVFMKLVILVLVAVVILGALAPAVFAQETKPINLALFDPVQIFKKDVAIKGFRFNLIYGNNAGMKGLDIGIANWVTGETVGIQWGVINYTVGNFTGWQTGPLGKIGGHMTGIQSGWLASVNASGKGLQASGVTVSNDFIGLQLGVVNYAVELHGIQIGLINIIKNGGMLPFFPIFNFSFDK